MGDKYLMTLYPSVWPLPFGVTIMEDRNPEHNYVVPPSQVQCWPVKLGDYQQVLITAVHNGMIGNQNNTIRAWLSVDPNGSNVIPPQFGTRLEIHLTTIGRSWCFYEVGLQPENMAKAEVSYIIDPKTIYYFNIQNLENKGNPYYLRFTFMRDGSTIEL